MAKRRRRQPAFPGAAWMNAGFDMISLGLESADVITRRSARLAVCGPDAGSEAMLMVTEKWWAAVELQTELMLGGVTAHPATVTRRAIRHYRRKVAANGRRLA